MIPKPFKEIKKVDLIENGKVTHYFKIVFLDGSSAVFDNNFNLVMKSKIVNLLPKYLLDRANALGKKLDQTNNNNGVDNE
tara:strand:- start:507 stop:746 length:240 start_codon:yes stop_codon:yes gene_type:complete